MGCTQSQSDDEDNVRYSRRRTRLPNSPESNNDNDQDEEQFKDFEEIGSNFNILLIIYII